MKRRPPLDNLEITATWSAMNLDKITTVLRVVSNDGATEIWSYDQGMEPYFLTRITSTSWRDICNALIDYEPSTLLIESLDSASFRIPEHLDYVGDLIVISWAETEDLNPDSRNFLLQLEDRILSKLYEQQGGLAQSEFMDEINSVVETLDDYADHLNFNDLVQIVNLNSETTILEQWKEWLERRVEEID